MINCPNCGAPRTGDKCEYCGTTFNTPEIDILKQEAATIKAEMITVKMNNEIIKALSHGISTGIFTPNECRRLIYERNT